MTIWGPCMAMYSHTWTYCHYSATQFPKTQASHTPNKVQLQQSKHSKGHTRPNYANTSLDNLQDTWEQQTRNFWLFAVSCGTKASWSDSNNCGPLRARVILRIRLGGGRGGDGAAAEMHYVETCVSLEILKTHLSLKSCYFALGHTRAHEEVQPTSPLTT